MGHDAGHQTLAYWPEYIALGLLMLGFFTALVIRSPFLNYTIIFLSGLLGGRVIYEKYRTQPIFPFVLLVIGFFLGFMLGAISADKKLITLLFLGGFVISYWAHRNGYVGFFRSASFIK